MRWPLPLLVVGSLGSLTGCSDLVIFGNRCPDGLRQCAQGLDKKDAGGDAGKDSGGEGGRDAEADGPVGGDADAADAQADRGAGDAQPDAPTDGGFDAFIRNLSFELTGGSQPGDLDDATTGTEIEPWRRCPNLFPPFEGLSVLPTGGLLGGFPSTEGDTMFRFSFLVPARFGFLTQKLDRPWPAGETRALTFDFGGQSVFNELRFTVLGSNQECPEADMREVLSSTEVPQTGEWARDVCVEMTPQQDVQWVILHAESALPTIALDGGGVTAQVFLDNLRESESCL